MADNKQSLPPKVEEPPKCPFTGPRFPKATRDVTSKNMDGISDLVVWAPIKEGFIDAFGNVTYASRLRIVAEALNKLRRNVREFQFLEPFADPTKRILSLLDFRIGVVERDLYGFGESDDVDGGSLRPRQYMYLTATFDGPWEPYMRQIWDPMGPFLDLVLCNCEGYTISKDTPFEDYIQWVRDHLLDTGMFYVVMGQTVKDHFYMQQLERFERELEDPEVRDFEISTHSVPIPEEEAEAVRDAEKGETMRLALEALNVLYQLTRFYPPDNRRTGQGVLLWRATHIILENKKIEAELEYIKQKHPVKLQRQKATLILKKMADQLDWYTNAYAQKVIPPSLDPIESNKAVVQKGILSSYDNGLGDQPITHAATLLLKIKNPSKLFPFLHPLLWSWEGDTFPFFRNLSFTYSALEKMPLHQTELMAFPKEFREGMEDRAPMLGDTHHNHPQRWRLPLRNGKKSTESLPRVSLKEVDLVVQLRTSIPILGISSQEPFIEFENEIDHSKLLFDKTLSKNEINLLSFENFLTDYFPIKNDDDLEDGVRKFLHMIYEEFLRLRKEGQFLGALVRSYINVLRNYGDLFGVELLSVQSSYRRGATESAISLNDGNDKFFNTPTPTDHFGFMDGISQPVFKDIDFSNQDEIKKSAPMDVRHGDVVAGFSNLLGDPQTENTLKCIQRHGSFLAIRKMSQDVKAFEAFLQTNAGDSQSAQDNLAAKLMGRTRQGEPLVKGAKDNTFNYRQDKKGLECPFASHIRRANPRDIIHGRKAPKLVRRGMSYGKPFREAPEEERGVLFMAYCANLAEQFETVQRWINGGNSTNVGSALVDPIVAPPPKDGDDVIKIVKPEGDAPRVKRLKRDPLNPFVKLEWGLYAFAPGKPALKQFFEDLKSGKKTFDKLIDSVCRGQKVVEAIEQLTEAEHRSREWKILLEDYLTKDPDEHAITSDVWAYIRSEHHGVYKINEGIAGHNTAEGKKPVILVADKQNIEQVLSDPETYSVSEIGTRLDEVFGLHYIGMDPKVPTHDTTDPYYKESSVTNQALYDYSAETAFDNAYTFSSKILDEVKTITKTIFRKEKFKIELTREYFAPSLAALCSYWFGLPDGNAFEPGAFLADTPQISKRKARCPGDFLGPSRGSFYPRPTPAIWDYAFHHGQWLRKSVKDLTSEWEKTNVKGKISEEIHKKEKNFDLLGRNIVGAMIGMLPSSEATLRMVTKDWLDDGTFWRLQGDLLSATQGGKPTYEQAQDIIEKSLIEGMSMRPAPDLLYRRANGTGKVGEADYEDGDTIILSLVSVMEADLAVGKPDLDTVFGGKRTGGSYNPIGIAHACPAKKMAMGSLIGILAALMNTGQIQAMPASLILEISGW